MVPVDSSCGGFQLFGGGGIDVGWKCRYLLMRLIHNSIPLNIRQPGMERMMNEWSNDGMETTKAFLDDP